VPQTVAAGLKEGDAVEVSSAGDAGVAARIVAVDARVDPATRNAQVRARIEGAGPAPGASVRVRVPVGGPRAVVAVPVSALRKGPDGDRVFVIAPDEHGKTRARARPVESGSMLPNDEVAVLSGLAKGQRVAASGSFKLRDGVLVTIANEPGAKSE
jgi:membrane fusion protein (multidrug efflux system)